MCCEGGWVCCKGGCVGIGEERWMCDVQFDLLHFCRYLLTSLVGSQQLRMLK